MANARKPFKHHHWQWQGAATVRLNWLEKGARPGDPGELHQSVPVQATLFECDQCGITCADVDVPNPDSPYAGATYRMTFYGLDRDSLCRCTSPSCEPLRAPETAIPETATPAADAA